ncbi:MAG TPA: VWA domain-containing protein [Fluviicola sp.]|nr:VWA domain-containing protein [Fluviicola sp.]
MIRYLIRIALFCCLITNAWSQPDTIDFGNIDRGTRRYADISVRNTSEWGMYIKSVEHSPQIVYRLDKEYIQSDSSFTIRLQVNPDTTGYFKYVMRVALSTSEPPVSLVVIGNVLEIPNYKNVAEQKCPEFEGERFTKETEFKIVSVDAVTRDPIPGSTVTIIRNGTLTESWVTGSAGSITRRSEPNFLYLIVSRNGYETTETGVFITPEVETISVPLKREEKDPVPPPDRERELAENPVRVAEEDLDETLSEQLETDSAALAEMAELFANFDTNEYKTVNVVFVLDLSSSMKLGEKMTLMKYSLNQLVKHMRPDDRIAFVTYSEGANLYMPTTNCMNKPEIYGKIADLEASGMASTTRGIKLGYKTVRKDSSPHEANMVIVITDGAFNNNSNDYQAIVRKYAPEGITFSVVGIQCRSNDERKMEEAAAYGKGRYVAIDKIADAQTKLLKEIKIASHR